MRFHLRTLLIVVALAPAIIWFSTVQLEQLFEKNRRYKPYESESDKQRAGQTVPMTGGIARSKKPLPPSASMSAPPSAP